MLPECRDDVTEHAAVVHVNFQDGPRKALLRAHTSLDKFKVHKSG